MITVPKKKNRVKRGVPSAVCFACPGFEGKFS